MSKVMHNLMMIARSFTHPRKIQVVARYCQLNVVYVCARARMALALTFSPLACSTREGGQRMGLAGFLRLARGGRALAAGSRSGCVESVARESQSCKGKYYFLCTKLAILRPQGEQMSRTEQNMAHYSTTEEVYKDPSVNPTVV